MFKLIILVKRKPGMSMDEFREYYEKKHAPLAASISPLMRRYIRNYITPVQNDLSSPDTSPYDCITESWFDNEEDYRRTMEGLVSNPEKVAMISKDEENLFDRSSIRWFTSVQSESAIGSSAS